jgi:hypothetical protein
VEELTDAAKQLAASNPSETYFLVQEIGRVAFEPVVTMTLAPPPLQPTVIYRGQPVPGSELPASTEPDGPKREPQVKPRLLIVDRKATPAELVGHLMVIAEGRIVKNAFGSLELADMPLSSAEHIEVAAVLRGAAQ